MNYDFFISVTTPAADRALLTIAQLRTAAGLDAGDVTQDAALTALGAQVSARISQACNIEVDGSNPPTLLQETITQTFRRHRPGSGSRPYGSSAPQETTLLLARSPVTAIISVTADGTLLDQTDYELRAADGMLVRLSNDCEIGWCFNKAIISMVTGLAAVPDDLSLMAQQLAQLIWFQGGDDPNKKMDWTDGLSRTEYFANPHADNQPIPPALMSALEAGGYVNHCF